jgi:mycothiol synthase
MTVARRLRPIRTTSLVGSSTAHPPARVDDRLVGACAVRDFEPTGPHPQTAIVGLVDPAWRGRGIGGRMLDWALQAATATPRVDTEMFTPEHDALLHSRGLRPTFAEDVMRVELPTSAAGTPLPAGLRLREWTAQLAEQFFAVYADRPDRRPGRSLPVAPALGLSLS